MTKAATLLLCSFVMRCAFGLEGGDELRVSEIQRYCQSAQQCALVYTRCDSCGCGVAINETFVAAHNQNLAALCASYHGPHCDKVCPVAEPVCVLGLCVMQPSLAL